MGSSKTAHPVRLIGLILAAGLVAAFWWQVNPVTLVSSLSRLRLVPLAVALALFAPQIAVSAFRWHLIAGCSLRTAARAVLVANALNLVLPGKLGEFAKAATSRRGIRFGAGLVVGERVGDVLVIVLLGGGLLFLDYPIRAFRLSAGLFAAAAFVALATASVYVQLRRLGQRGCELAVLAAQIFRPGPLIATALLWFLHGVQVALFAEAVGASSRPPLLFTLAQWIFLGSAVPLAPWGLGSREGVMFLLLSPVERSSVIGATALLFLLRYWVPGLVGLPVLTVHGLRGVISDAAGRGPLPVGANPRKLGRTPARRAA